MFVQANGARLYFDVEGIDQCSGRKRTNTRQVDIKTDIRAGMKPVVFFGDSLDDLRAFPDKKYDAMQAFNWTVCNGGSTLTTGNRCGRLGRA